MKKNKTLNVVLGFFVLLVLFVFAFPFLWMLIASFKTQAQIMST